MSQVSQQNLYNKIFTFIIPRTLNGYVLSLPPVKIWPPIMKICSWHFRDILDIKKIYNDSIWLPIYVCIWYDKFVKLPNLWNSQKNFRFYEISNAVTKIVKSTIYIPISLNRQNFLADFMKLTYIYLLNSWTWKHTILLSGRDTDSF